MLSCSSAASAATMLLRLLLSCTSAATMLLLRLLVSRSSAATIMLWRLLRKLFRRIYISVLYRCLCTHFLPQKRGNSLMKMPLCLPSAGNLPQTGGPMLYCKSKKQKRVAPLAWRPHQTAISLTGVTALPVQNTII